MLQALRPAAAVTAAVTLATAAAAATTTTTTSTALSTAAASVLQLLLPESSKGWQKVKTVRAALPQVTLFARKYLLLLEAVVFACNRL